MRVPPLPPKVKAIVEEVCAERRIKRQGAVFGRGRKKPIAWVRHEIWWRLRQLEDRGGRPISYPRIGMWFDRDHTTVLAGVREHEARMQDGSLETYWF